MEKEPAIFVGVDWASTEHQVCMIGPSGPVQRAFAHDAGGLGANGRLAMRTDREPVRYRCCD
jgi:hypothetical protein